MPWVGDGRGVVWKPAETAGTTSSVTSPNSTTYSADQINALTNEILAQANSTADTAKAAGLKKEETAYTAASGIATSNAEQEAQFTALTQAQEQRNVTKTIGGQRADIAAAGFKNAGSSLALIRNSVQQGALQQQLTGLQGSLAEGGYLTEAAAATAEANAAGSASDAETALAKAEGTISTMTTASSIADIASSLGLPVPAATTTTTKGTLSSKVGTTAGSVRVLDPGNSSKGSSNQDLVPKSTTTDTTTSELTRVGPSRADTSAAQVVQVGATATSAEDADLTGFNAGSAGSDF